MRGVGISAGDDSPPDSTRESIVGIRFALEAMAEVYCVIQIRGISDR